MTNPWSTLSHDAVGNQLLTEAGRIVNTFFFRQKRNVDQWYRDFFPQKDFPRNMGENPTYPVYGSLVPAAPIPMSQIGFSNCETNSSPCDPGFVYVPNQSITQMAMTLWQTPIMRSTDVCFDDLNLSWNPDQYMDQRVMGLVDYTKWAWSYMGLNALLTGPITKVVMAPYANNTLPMTQNVSAANPWSATAIQQALPTITPTTGLSTGVFVRAYRTFIDLGLAGNDSNTVGRAPSFDAFFDPEDLLTMTVNDPAFRQDTRFGSAVDGLRQGIQGIYNNGGFGKAMGFDFHPLSYPPRFTFADSEYTQVAPFNAGTATTVGNVQNTTQAYNDAPIGGGFLVGSKESFFWQIPEWVRKFGKATFGNNNYAGEFGWQNYQTDNNVLMTKGFFTAQIKAGWAFPFANRIWLVLYLRCGVALDTIICSVNGQPTCETPTYPEPPEPVDPVIGVNPCIQIPYPIP